MGSWIQLPFFMNQTYRNLSPEKRIYVASDFHLGSPNLKASQSREEKINRWIDSVKSDAAAFIFAGDIFDFWFEYKEVVPKGFLRFLGKLSELRHAGIDIIFFIGNHDLWMFDYFEKELDILIYKEPVSFEIGANKIQIGHGDGLGPGDRKFKFFKSIFNNTLAQWAFRWLHPDIGIRLAKAWSGHSKQYEDPYLGENEPLVVHCKQVESDHHHDYYLFGHRHLILDMPIGEQATYYNLGEWFQNSRYIEISATEVTPKVYEE